MESTKGKVSRHVELSQELTKRREALLDERESLQVSADQLANQIEDINDAINLVEKGLSSVPQEAKSIARN